MKKGVILYYVVGPVHRENMQLIAKEMPDWEFIMLYEPDCWWNSAQELKKFDFEKIPFVHNQVPEEVWTRDIRSVIFSVVQPRLSPLNLLKSALRHNVPTIAIEESNQMALNQGVINSHNNYLYPTDYTFVVSEFERQALIKVGVSDYRIEVTGWPFYSGPIGKVHQQERDNAKIKLGLDIHRPVATLTLTAFGSAGETPEVRRRQLLLASKGLPDDYQLLVKPHPIEKLATLQPFIASFAPRAKVIEGAVPVSEVLKVSDVLLNRGVSQVAIEALFQEIPVVVLSTGIITPFHGYADNFIVEQPEQLNQLLSCIETKEKSLSHYDRFKAMHMPYHPHQARKLACQRIAEISEKHIAPVDRCRQWLELSLFQAWRMNFRGAIETLSYLNLNGYRQARYALIKLCNNTAERQHIELLKGLLRGSFLEEILRCLWIRQLYRRRLTVTAFDIEWLKDFPPRLNEEYFLEYVSLWSEVLLRDNKRSLLENMTLKLSPYAGYHPVAKKILELIALYDSCGSSGIIFKLRISFRKFLTEIMSQLKRIRRFFKKILYRAF